MAVTRGQRRGVTAASRETRRGLKVKVVLGKVVRHRRAPLPERRKQAQACRRGPLRVAVRLGGTAQTAENLLWKQIVREWLTVQSDEFEAAAAVLPEEVTLASGAWYESE